MDHETLRAVWGFVVLVSLFFFAYTKGPKLNDISDKLIRLYVENPKSAEYSKTKRQFNFWNKVPSIMMLIVVLISIYVTGLL